MQDANEKIEMETLGRYRRPKNSNYIPERDHASQIRTEEILFTCKVSRDEVDRWHNCGWLSFKAEDLPTEMDWSDFRVMEIAFIMDLARSGLGDIQICYDPPFLGVPCSGLLRAEGPEKAPESRGDPFQNGMSGRGGGFERPFSNGC